MNKPAKKPKLLSSKQTNSSFNSWEKIQSLIEQETIKENLISIQEEMENDFLEAVSFNWSQMSPAEKKSAIRLGCLVQSLRKNLKRAFAKDYH
jgi:hypothetical protein